MRKNLSGCSHRPEDMGLKNGLDSLTNKSMAEQYLQTRLYCKVNHKTDLFLVIY